MTRRKTILRALVAVAASVAAAPMLAQNPGRPQSPRETVVNRFEEGTPDVGQRVPDVQVYDDAGNKRNLRELKGQYTVLVFGCLT